MRVTPQQIQRVEAELDAIASIASPSMKKDIEAGRQRYPRETFIGMTMSEALEYAGAKFLAEQTIEPAATTPEAPAQLLE